jgi:hypothetical protein
MNVPLLVHHDPHCTQRGFGHSDAAKRISDVVNLHWAAAVASPEWNHVVGRWCAFRLSDGTGGMQLYDTKRDAIRYQLDEFQCMYLCMAPGGMGVCEAELQLRTCRQMYLNGHRMTDPDHKKGGRELITRVAGEHRTRILQMLEYPN